MEYQEIHFVQGCRQHYDYYMYIINTIFYVNPSDQRYFETDIIFIIRPTAFSSHIILIFIRPSKLFKNFVILEINNESPYVKTCI